MVGNISAQEMRSSDIAGAVGLGAAIDYLDRMGFEAASLYEEALMAYATEALAAIPELRQIGTARHKGRRCPVLAI